MKMEAFLETQIFAKRINGIITKATVYYRPRTYAIFTESASGAWLLHIETDRQFSIHQ